MKLHNRGTLAGIAIVLPFTVVACGGGEETVTSEETAAGPAQSATAATEVDEAHDEADTQFAQMMIVHHEGAIEMADLAVAKAESEEVRTLAEGISAAQGPEIEEMTGWLEAWREDVEPMAGHGGMDHGGMDMEGMSQEEAMGHLDELFGTDFDLRFLELMIAHHEGAVEMAETQLEDGENPQALALAEKIIADQETEITEMEEMLPAL